MQLQELASTYRAKTDEELLQLSLVSGQLTPEALSVLKSELARRKIEAPSSSQPESGTILKPPSRTNSSVHGHQQHVAAFIANVIDTYRTHFWLFIKLIAPGVLLSYLGVMARRHEVREIAKHFPRGFHSLEIFEISCINLASYLASWLVLSLSYAAICAAVDQISRSKTTTAAASFATVRARLGAFLRASIFLFAIYGAGIAAVGLLGGVVLSKLRSWHLPGSAYWLITYVLVLGVMLVLSRLGLAIPAVLLDNYRTVAAVFRSDELTEGEWMTLAALLVKSAVAGYVAWMLPFWVRSWAWNYVQLPESAAIIGSIAGVTLVEPTLFIGLALLYVQTSSTTPAARPTSTSFAAPERNPSPSGTA